MKRIIFFIVCICATWGVMASEKFPDGTPIDNMWFYSSKPVEIEKLGKQYLVTDYGVKQDSTLLQTEALQAVIDRAAENGVGSNGFRCFEFSAHGPDIGDGSADLFGGHGQLKAVPGFQKLRVCLHQTLPDGPVGSLPHIAALRVL